MNEPAPDVSRLATALIHVAIVAGTSIADLRECDPETALRSAPRIDVVVIPAAPIKWDAAIELGDIRGRLDRLCDGLRALLAPTRTPSAHSAPPAENGVQDGN